jgi:hypothetical protein
MHPLPIHNDRQYKQALMYFDKAIDYTYAAVRVDVAYTLVRFFFFTPPPSARCVPCALRVDVK